MAVQRITCLSCGGSTFTRDEQNHLVCEHCGSIYQQKGNVCAKCGTVNPANAFHCSQCGERLKRRCPVCQHENPGDAEYCANCNAALDTLEFITRRYLEEGKQNREELVRSKQDDAAFVAEQGERLNEIDRQRLAALAVQKAEQQRKERLLLKVAIGGGVALLLILAAMVVLRILLGGG